MSVDVLFLYLVGVPRHLPLHQLRVDAAQLHQRRMVALFDDSALIDDSDFVCVNDGGQPVGHEDDGAASLHLLDEVIEGFLHLRLALGVKRRGGLVQQQQPGLPKEHTGDGNTLFLTSGQPDAPLACACLIAVIEPHDEVVRTGLLGGIDQLSPGVWSVVSICDVLLDAIGEQLCVLRNQTDLLSVGPQVQPGQGHAVNQNGPLLWVIEPLEEVDEGRLAPTRPPNERTHTAARNVQIDAGKDGLLGPHLVGEDHIVKPQVALHRVRVEYDACDLSRPGALDVRLAVEELEHTLGRGSRTHQVVDHAI
mmetsp:Transcript_29520/g.73514  ORF Transcript_29520/g.73514 Transcript_29520/m.73514 type:complete len:308 (-) Transcript_29520:1576-2499(-)